MDKQTIIDKLEEFNYKCENYLLGIKVHMSATQYIDISRQSNNELTLDVYTFGKLDPASLEILEDRGRIRFESLIKILDSIKYKF